jgi:hypothetical protein
MKTLQLPWSRRSPPVNTPNWTLNWTHGAISLGSLEELSSGLTARLEIRKSTAQSSKSHSHIANAGQSVSKSWCRAPSGAHDHIFITVWHLRSWFCGAPSLKRERVCLLYMLLALANKVFLGSESLGTHDHILLFQIWGFPFRRSYDSQGRGPNLNWTVEAKSKSHWDWRSVSLGVEPNLWFMTRYLLLFVSFGLIIVGRPIWQKDGSVFCQSHCLQ